MLASSYTITCFRSSSPFVFVSSSPPAFSRRVLPDTSSLNGAWVWGSALALFVVAGGTGAFFRFGMVYGWTGGLELEHIRHAHSHLMYFGWGTPALMVLIWRCLPDDVTASRERIFRWVVGGVLTAAVLAYPLFLLFGYSPVQMGAARLPIAVIGASLNILCWYGFVGLYVTATRSLPRTGALRLWDVAVGALVLATLGAWSLALLPALGLHNPLIATALTHVFLDLFSEGWFVLGGLGVAFALLPSNSDGPASWSVWLVALGLPFTFLLALPVSRLPIELAIAGRAGGAVVGIGLLVMTVRLMRGLPHGTARWLWGVPLAFLAVKAGAQLAGSLVPGLWPGASHGLRILYLHLMLLGFLSPVLVAGAQTVWARNALCDIAIFYGAVGLLLATLLPLTSWGFGGVAAYAVAAWGALGPVLAAAWMLSRAGATARVSTRQELEALDFP